MSAFLFYKVHAPYYVIHSGCSKHFGGIMILIHESIATQSQVESINALIPGRLLTARTRSKIYGGTIVGGYAPQSEAKSTSFSRSICWSTMDSYLRRLPFRTLKLVLLDANAHVAHSLQPLAHTPRTQSIQTGTRSRTLRTATTLL